MTASPFLSSGLCSERTQPSVRGSFKSQPWGSPSPVYQRPLPSMALLQLPAHLQLLPGCRMFSLTLRGNSQREERERTGFPDTEAAWPASVKSERLPVRLSVCLYDILFDHSICPPFKARSLLDPIQPGIKECFKKSPRNRLLFTGMQLEHRLHRSSQGGR